MLATACGWVSPTPAGELESRLASPSNETRVAPEARLQRQRYPSWGALSSRGSRLVLSPALEGETLVSGWHEVAPPRRSWHVAVFDSRRNRLLLCGGAFHGTLWSYELVTRTWSEIPLTAPGPDLVGACGIYDPIRDRVVVFGGRNSYGDPSADTWVLDLRGAPQWTKLSATGLTPREEASAAYDPVGDRMIVFGGIRFVHPFSDLSTLDLSRPTKWKVFAASPQSSPGPRELSALIVDSRRNRLAVIGGYTLVEISDHVHESHRVPDSWELDLSRLAASAPLAWDSLPGSGPSGVVFPVLDTLNHTILACSGEAPESSWSIVADPGAEWGFVGTPEPRPSRRGGASTARLPDGGLLLSGGEVGYGTAEVWRLRSSAATGGGVEWTLLAADSVPPPRFGHRIAYDPRRDAMLMTGGVRSEEYTVHDLSDIWRYGFGTGHWTRLAATDASAPGRLEPAVVNDYFHDRLVMFGGFACCDRYLRDLWQFRLEDGDAWVPLEAAGDPPPGRWGQSAIFDPLRRRMIVFGGDDSLGHFSNQVTALALDGAPRWAEIVPAGVAPPPRSMHTAVYDPIRDQMIVFGGAGSDGAFSDGWTLSLGSQPEWKELHPLGRTPASRERHCAAFDADHDRMVIQGGFYGEYDVIWEYPDTGILSLIDEPAWSSLWPLTDSPLWRNGSAMMADPRRADLVLLGGLSGGFDADIDLWRYDSEPRAPEEHRAWLMGISREEGRLRIRWYAPRLSGSIVSIDRSVDRRGWVKVADAAVDSEGIVTYLAAAQEPGQDDGYRLRLESVAAAEGEVHLPVPVGPVTLLYGAQPNPARGSFEMRFMLPGAGSARLSLYDVQGRTVWEREVGSLGTGVHRVTVPPTSAPHPGIYFLRLASLTGVATGKIVILR